MSVPVIHRGIRFRSTLEARWTLVFEGLGAQWSYEPKRFDLPSGVYVPDFRLVYEGATFWVEIKGPWPDAREVQVASEINLYVGPLIILSGDVPRRGHGGTAWWFDVSTARWSMVSPAEAILRTVYTEDVRPADLDWDRHLAVARMTQFERARGVHQGG